MNSWIGDRKFYRMAFHTAIPIVIQQLVTSFVSMLDNIMVGQVGTLQMSAVSIANQLLNIFMLAVFGTVTGAGIYGAQFAGKQDWENDRKVLRFKLVLTGIITLGFMNVYGFFGKQLLGTFMNPDTNSPSDISRTMSYASSYLYIMLVGMIAYYLSQTLASSIRETGETVLPMISSIVAVAVNFIFNSILIFGLLGFPAMGVSGAAIATVLSRFAELAIIVAGAYRSREHFPFFQNVFDEFTIGKKLAKDIFLRALPLIGNETLWSFGLAAITQCYSTRGLDGIAAYNISNTIASLFNAVYIGSGSAISILTGHRLGAGDNDGAFSTARRMTVLIFTICIGVGILLFFTAPVFPSFYNTSDHVRLLATQLLRITAVFIPVQSLYNSFYFILRSGGKTVITFFFDSFYTCTVSLGTAYVLSRFTSLSLLQMFMVVTAMDILKVIIGFILVQKRVWIQNLTE